MRIALHNFTGGEVSPILAARYDLSRYSSSVQCMENMLPGLHGDVRRRPGTLFLGGLEDEAVLLPFSFNALAEQNFVLVLAGNSLRIADIHGFDTQGGIIPTLPTPYEARHLLEELRRGRYADAAQLPSELELADVLGVSRTVVRDALSDLERDGYVERVRGIGTLVNRDVVRVENRMDQKLEFNRMIRSIGRVPHSDNLMVTRETAMPELAAKLGLDPEREHTLVFVRRRVLADETPVLYSTDILPLALFGGKRLDTIDFSRPIFEIVEQHCHVEVTETLTTLHAVQGVPGIRRQLGLRPEQALWQLDEICYSRTCKPVLCCQTCYTDFFDFAMVRKLI